ncbi:MAG: Flagellar hook-basal body complex protein FliE [Candidatus Brocadiaceae bacterium]|nr:Flagellar hook-basal body complex protein FliE [Candidatus Brocadiaceae bacterium]
MGVSPINNNGNIPVNNEFVNSVEGEDQKSSFKNTLGGFINEINDLQTKADKGRSQF